MSFIEIYDSTTHRTSNILHSFDIFCSKNNIRGVLCDNIQDCHYDNNIYYDYCHNCDINTTLAILNTEYNISNLVSIVISVYFDAQHVYERNNMIGFIEDYCVIPVILIDLNEHSLLNNGYFLNYIHYGSIYYIIYLVRYTWIVVLLMLCLVHICIQKRRPLNYVYTTFEYQEDSRQEEHENPNEYLNLISVETFDSEALNSESSSDHTCAICLEDYKNNDQIGILHCEHKFHKDCITHWFKEQHRCPLCNDES